MTRAHGTLHHLRHRAEIEHAGVSFRIYFLGRGHECKVYTAALEHGAVGLFGARIGAQVIGIIKLGGVYKYAHHYHVVFTACTLYQRFMAGMKGAHSGHQAYGLALPAAIGHHFGKTVDSTDYFHFLSFGGPIIEATNFKLQNYKFPSNSQNQTLTLFMFNKRNLRFMFLEFRFYMS